MKRTLTIALLFATLAVSALAADDQYVVTFRPEAAMDQLPAVAEQFAAAYGGTVIDVDGIRGTLLVRLPESRMTTAQRDPRVKSIRPATDASEVVPWSTGVTYAYDGAGNVTRIGTSDEFVYDVASRLVQAKINGQTRNYEYDAYGNRTKCLQSSTDCQGHTIDATTNRISGTNNHDAAGNVTSLDGHTYSYDALNMQVRDVDTARGVVREYVYTADEERIAVYTVGQWWRWTIRDTSGKVLREYMSEGEQGTSNWQWVKDYVWRDGTLLGTRHVPPGGSTAVMYHYHVDHLGTPRRITDDADRIVGFHDYLAFGPETTTGKIEPSLTLFKYTAHERDVVETSLTVPLDYMHARYYSSQLGRFLGVDPVLAKNALRKPQTWNRYSYAENSPFKYVDPSGTTVWLSGTNAEREEMLRHIRNLLHSREAAKFLTYDKFNRLTVTGMSVAEWGKKFGGSAAKLAALISSPYSVGVGFTTSSTTRKSGGGGFDTIGRNMGVVNIVKDMFPHEEGGVMQYISTVLAHELFGHAAYDAGLLGRVDTGTLHKEVALSRFLIMNEWDPSGMWAENQYRAMVGLPIRKFYIVPGDYTPPKD